MTDINGAFLLHLREWNPNPWENEWLPSTLLKLLYHLLLSQWSVKGLLLLHIGRLCINTFPTKPVGTGDDSMAINAFPAWLCASEIYYKGFKPTFSKIHLRNGFIIIHINERQKECPMFMIQLLSIFIVCMDWSFKALTLYRRTTLPFCPKPPSS